MAVLSLVLGIISIAILSWLGPVIGAAVGAPSAEQLMSGTGTFSSGPAYGIAVFISIILPIVSLVFGIMGLKAKKGVSIAGIITSAFGLLLGIILTVVIVGGASAAMSLASSGLAGLNDPAAQQQLQDALNQAMQQATPPAAPPAPPAQ